MKKLISTDELIQGIRFILSNDRCSFTNEERVLLQECLSRLQETKINKRQIDLKLITDIVSTLLQAFNLFKDVF